MSNSRFLRRRHLHQLISRSQRRRLRRAKRSSANRLHIENLEARQLLSVNSALTGSTVTFVGDSASDDLYLRLNTGNQQLEYSLDGVSFTNDMDPSAGVQPLVVNSSSVAIAVSMGAGTDGLFITADLSNQLDTTGAALEFNGGTGNDQLHGPQAIANKWQVLGTTVGRLNNQITYLNVEDHEGGQLNDTFEFDNGIVFTGRILGNHGILHIDGDEDVTFSSATISSRQVASGGSHLTGSSIGDSGDILVTAEEIVVQGATSIVADADLGFAPGNIELHASSSSTSILGNETSSILVSDSLVRGHNVSLAAETEISATAEGLPASLGSDLAVIINAATATATVGGTSNITSTGDVLISSRTEVADKAVAYAGAGGVFDEDAAVASIKVSTDSVAMLTDSASVDAVGTLTVRSDNETDIRSESDGDENGTEAKGATVATNIIDVRTRASIDKSATVVGADRVEVIAESADNIRADADSTPKGATGNSTTTDTLLDDFKATTTDGDIEVATALAITDFERDVQAFIATDAPIASSIEVKTVGIATGSVATDADASVTTNTAAEAIGVGINSITSRNHSYVSGLGTITTGDVSIVSQTHNDTHDNNTYQVSAKSGIGAAGEYAGAFAANLVVNSSEARATSSANLAATGNVTIDSRNKSDILASATPHEATATVDVGTGASVAIQVVENLNTAQIDDGALVSGAQDVSVNAESDHKVSTKAEAGVKAGVAKAPVVAATYHRNETLAQIRSGDELQANGDITVASQNTGATSSDAKGSLHAQDRATNASFSFTIASDTVTAETVRDLDAGGDVSIKAHQSAKSDADATASITGTQIEEDTAADDKSETLEEQANNTKGLLNARAADQGTTIATADVPEAETPEGKTVQFAGAFAVNLPTSISDAQIAPDLVVNAGADINVTSCNNTDGRANADASIVPEEVTVEEDAATETTLVPAGAVWKYFTFDQGREWTFPDYDDQQWDEGVAPLGYAEQDVATVIDVVDPVGLPPTTTYFRTEFDLSDQATFEELGLRMRFDDAAAIYINGVEVARTEGLPPQASFDELSQVSIEGDDEQRYFEFDLTEGLAQQVLRPGRNVVAIEVHQDRRDSFDLAFDAELTAQKPSDQTGSTTKEIKTGVAIAVAVNVPLAAQTTATIGENTAATGENILVETSMRPLAFDDGSDTTHSFSAHAQSGVGSSEEISKAVAGALAVNVVSNHSLAAIKPNADIQLTGGDLTVSATDNAENVANALPQKDPTTAETRALGASFAVDVAQNKTLAEIGTNVDVSNAVDISVLANSTDKMLTKAEAGVKAGKAFAPVVGVSYHNNDTTAVIRPGPEIVQAGDANIAATHAGSTVTNAEGSAEATQRAINAAFALTISEDTTLATLERNLDASGSVTVSAHSSAKSDADATAAATGTLVKEDGDEQSEKAEEQSDNVIDHVNQLAAGKGVDTTDADTPEPETPEKKQVQFAAAVAVNLPESIAEAWIPEDLIVSAGEDLSVVACNNTDAHANADASVVLKSATEPNDTTAGENPTDPNANESLATAVGQQKASSQEATDGNSDNEKDEAKTTGIAAAIAINIPREARTRASIGERTSATGRNVLVETRMQTLNDGEGNSDATHAFGAKGVSGVGSKTEGSKSFAGSLAINVVNELSHAVIQQDADVTLTGGDLTVSATDTSTSTSEALPKKDNVTGDISGLGASFAINVVQNDTLAEIGSNVSVASAVDITVETKTDHRVTTKAEAGVTAGKALAPVIGVTYHNDDTIAAVRPGSAILQSGTLTISSRASSLATTDAKGATDAEETAVSAALALNIADHHNEAILQRYVDAGNDVFVNSHATSKTHSESFASASGTKVEEDSTAEKQSEEADEQADNVTSFVNDVATDNQIETTDADTPEPKTPDGSVTFAAAVGINIASSNAVALIDNGLIVSAGDQLQVIAGNNTDAHAKADAKAINQGQVRVGVGVAVGINWVDPNTTATVGEAADISAQDILIRAYMTSIPVDNENDTQNSFHADAISAAGANNVGVAGAFALNRVKLNSLADLQTNAVVTLLGGELSVQSDSESESGASALSKEEGSDEAKVGVGASVALDLLQHTTTAFIANGVTVDGATDILVSANTEHSVATKATGGSQGGVSVTPAFAMSSVKNDTSARIDSGAEIVVGGGIDIRTKQLTQTTTTADANAAGDKAIIGIAVSLGLVRDSVTAFTERSLDAKGDVDITAFSHSNSDSFAIAAAAGGKVEDEATEEDAVDKDVNEKLDFADSLADEGDVDKPSEDAPSAKTDEGTVSVAAAVAIELAKITTHAYVGAGHTVSARDLLISAASDADSRADADAKAVNVNGQNEVGVGAAVAINRPIVDTQAFVDSGSSISTQKATLEAIIAVMEMDGQQLGGTHSFVADATSGAGSTKVSVAGSLALNTSESTHRAWLGPNAIVTDAILILDADNVTDNTATANAHAPSTDGNLGIGASVALNRIENTTETLIDSNVQVNSLGNVQLEPTAHSISQTTAQGGAEGGVAIDASVAITTLNETTAGAISDGATLNANGDVVVDADHRGSDNTTADGAFNAAKVGIGASFALVVSNGLTEAKLDRSATAAGDIRVNANSDRTYNTIAFSSADGAGHPDDLNTSTDDAASFSALDDYNVSTDDGAVNVAAALAISDLNNNVRSLVTPAKTLNAGGSIRVAAQRLSGFHSKGDASAVSFSTNVGIGVGVALSLVDGESLALLDDSINATAAGNIEIQAQTHQNSSGLRHHQVYRSRLAAEAVSGGGGTKVGVAGAFALVDSDIATLAYADDDSQLTAGQNIDVDAFLQSKIGGAASSIATGKVGVGASVSVIDSDNLVHAFLANQVVADAAHLEIDAINAQVGTGGFSFIDFGSFDKFNTIRQNNYYNEAIGGSAGDSVAVQGSFAITTLDDSIESRVGDDVTLNVSNDLQIESLNDTSTRSIVGNIAGSSGVSVGISNADTINNTVTKSFLGTRSNATVGDDVTIRAQTEQEFAALGVSAALAGKVGVAGVVLVLVSDNIDEAFVSSQALVSAGGNMLVDAENRIITKAIAGQLAGGGSAGIGASNVTNIIRNQTQAHLDSQVVADVTGTLSIDADGVQDMFAITAGGAGAGSVGIAGSATVNKVETTTEAHIAPRTLVNTNTTGQSVVLDANDETYLLSIAGSAVGGGSVGIGAGADVGVIDKTTKAYIASTAVVNATNIVGVEASSKEDISSLAASLGIGGSVGIAGAAGIYTLDIATQSYIDDEATVLSNGNVRVHADDENELDIIDGNLTGAGSVSVGAAAAVTTVNKLVEAFVGKNADVTALGSGAMTSVATGDFLVSHLNNTSDGGEVFVPEIQTTQADDLGLTKQRFATPKTTSFRGLSVTAINRDDIETITLSGGAAGSVAINAGGSVNVINADTRAYAADGAQINSVNTGGGSGQSILIAAGSDLNHVGITGVASGAGTVSIAPGADITVVNNETVAFMGTDVDAKANNRVTINAQASEDILSVSAGVAAAGTVGVAGAVSPVKVNNTTHAFVDAGATVFAHGNMVVSASDDTDADIIAGALGAGGAVGVGGSVGVVNIEKDTQAFLAGMATVDALGDAADEIIVVSEQTPDGLQTELSGHDADLPMAATLSTTSGKGLSVHASSSEDITNIVVAGAGGYFAGVAGAVAVDIVDSNTLAFIGPFAQINQSGDTPSADQAVYVTANNDVELLAVGGSVALGIAGVAGGVDVGVIKNDTSAFIDDGAVVSAKQDVSVQAFADKTVDSWAAGVGAGFVGVAGSVSVYGISGDLDADSMSSLNTTTGPGATSTPEYANTQSYVDAQLGKSGMPTTLAAYRSDPADASMNSSIIDQASGASSANVNSILGGSVRSTLGTPISAGTTAFIDRSAEVDAGREIIVNAESVVDLEATVGGLAVGVVGAGGSVSVANVDENVESYIAGNVFSEADTRITATFDERMDGSAYAGQAGLVGLGAQVVVHKDHSTVDASLRNTSRVLAAEDVHISASSTQDLSADAIGGQLAGLALGASIATTRNDGSTRAYVADGTNLSPADDSLFSVRDLTVTANSNISTISDTIAVQAGIVSGSGSVANATIDPDVAAFVGNNANVSLGRDLDIIADSQANSDADALGVAAALGASIGVSSARATVTPVVESYIGRNAIVRFGDDANVIARHNVNAAGANINGGATTEATAPAVGLLLGGSGAVAKSTTSPNLDASIRSGSQIHAGDNVNVRALSHDSADSVAKGIGIGIVGIGLTDGEALAAGQTHSQITGNVLSGRHVVIESVDRHDANTKTRAVAGGIVSGAGSLADATVRPTVRANTGSETIDVRGDISITARSETDADADARGVGAALGVGIGYSGADARLAPNVDAFVEQNANINAAGSVSLLASHNYTTGGNAILNEASTSANAPGVGILAGVSGAITDADADSDVTSQIRTNATVSAGEDVDVISRNNDVAESIADGDAFGIVGVGIITANADVTGTSDAQILNSAIVSAGRDINLESLYRNDVNADLTTASGGLISVADNTSTAQINTRSTATSGTGSTLNAGRNINLEAGGLASGKADSTGIQVGLVTVGHSKATADERMTVQAALGTGTVTNADNDVTVQARHNFTSGGSAITGNQMAANAKATAGGLAGSVSNTTVASNSRLTVDALIGTRATVTVGNDVNVNAFGGGRASSTADGRSLGLIAAVGRNLANSSVVNRTTAFVQPESTVTAGHDVNMLSRSTNYGEGDAIGGTGALLLGIASTDGNAKIDNRTVSRVGTNAQIDAENQILIQAVTRNDTHSSGTIETGGLITKNRTESDSDIDSETNVIVDSDAYLTADYARLHAIVERTVASGDAFSKTIAAGSTTDAASLVDVISEANVIVHSDAIIEACKLIELLACHLLVDTDSDALARIAAGVTGTVTAQGHNDLNIDSNIDVQVNATLRTDSLVVNAKAPQETSIYNRTAEADADTVVQYVKEVVEEVKKFVSKIPIIGWIIKWITCLVEKLIEVVLHSDETALLTGSLSSHASVNIDGNVEQCPPKRPKITIGRDGRVTAEGITFEMDDDEIVIGDILNDALHSISIAAPSGRVTGQGKISFAKTFEAVEIVNNSDKDVRIRDVRVRADNPQRPDLEITAGKDESQFDLASMVGETLVEIENTGNGHIILEGEIVNPFGIVTIRNANGDIQASPNSLVHAHDVTLQAPKGNIGGPQQPIRLDVVAGTDIGAARVIASALEAVELIVRSTEYDISVTPDYEIEPVDLTDINGARSDVQTETPVVFIPSFELGEPATEVEVLGAYDFGGKRGSFAELADDFDATWNDLADPFAEIRFDDLAGEVPTDQYAVEHGVQFGMTPAGVAANEESQTIGTIDGYDGVTYENDRDTVLATDGGLAIVFDPPVSAAGSFIALPATLGDAVLPIVELFDVNGQSLGQASIQVKVFDDDHRVEGLWFASTGIPVVGSAEIRLPSGVSSEMFIDNIRFARPETVTRPGDFDGDNILDCSDLRELNRVIISGEQQPRFDLNGDGQTNFADQSEWVALANPLAGDANLDNRVDAADLNTIGLSWRSQGEWLTWCDGDFTGDQAIDARDLNALALNWRAGTNTMDDSETQPMAASNIDAAIAEFYGGEPAQPKLRFAKRESLINRRAK